MTVAPNDMPCPETSDSQHCGHWHDGGKCCACGQSGPDWDGEED
jgi:hypothetical protein